MNLMKLLLKDTQGKTHQGKQITLLLALIVIGVFVLVGLGRLPETYILTVILPIITWATLVRKKGNGKLPG